MHTAVVPGANDKNSVFAWRAAGHQRRWRLPIRVCGVKFTECCHDICSHSAPPTKQQTTRRAAIETTHRAYKCSKEGGEVRSGPAGVKASDRRIRQIALLTQHIGTSNRRRKGARPTRSRAKMYAVDVAEPSRPLFRLFYQVEISCLQFSKIANLLTAADTRDGTTRLWQLRGRPVKIE
jgi:hypothetical protein